MKRDFIQKRLYAYHFLNDGITFLLPTLMANFYILFQLTWFQMGLIFAFNLLATIVGQLIVGYYTDKNITEFLMKIGVLLLAISSFLMIFSYNFISLLFFAIFSGIALAFQHSISYATTSRMYYENQDVMIGRQGAAGDVGKCVAVFSSSLIVIFISWKFVLLSWSILIFVFFIIITHNFRNVKFNELFIDSEPKKDNIEDKDKIKLKLSKFVSFIILTVFVLHLAVYSLLITNLATYLRVERAGIVSRYSGFILGYALIFGVLGAYFSGTAKKKYGMTNSILTFSTILIASIIVYLLHETSDLALTLIFYAIIGFFLFLMYPQLLATVNHIFHIKKVGFGYGIILCLGWFGSFLGSLIGGYLADIYSGDIFFVISVILLIIIIQLAIIIKLQVKSL